MNKNLLSWVIALSVSLVFFSSVALFAYWTITRAAWWLCDLASLAVFAQGIGIFLWGKSVQRQADREVQG